MQPLVTDRGAFDKRGPGFGVKVPNLDGVPGDPLAQLDRLLRRTEFRSHSSKHLGGHESHCQLRRLPRPLLPWKFLAFLLLARTQSWLF